MKVNITVIDPLGIKQLKELDDDGKGIITIGDASNDAEAKGILRLASTQVDKLHAQIVFGREISASPFERQLPEEALVCHLIVLNDKGNVYRADHSIATPAYQFIPWYRGDAYVFGDYTLLFDQEEIPDVPFLVEIKPTPSVPLEVQVGQSVEWNITVKTTGDRIPNVRLELLPPPEFADLKEPIHLFQPKLININENKEGISKLKIQIPKDSYFVAGKHEFTLRVSAEEYRFYEPKEITIRLNLQPFTDFTFAPYEPVAKERAIAYFDNWWFKPDYWFKLGNKSNESTTFEVIAKDNFGKSRYDIEQLTAGVADSSQITYGRNPQEVILQPGEETDVRVLARLRGRRHWGLRPQRYAIDIAAAPQGSSQPIVHNFDLLQRPFAPSWLFLLLLSVAIWLAFFIYKPRIYVSNFADLNNQELIPNVPVVANWSTSPFVTYSELATSPNITRSGVLISHRWLIFPTYSQTVTFPIRGSYFLTATAQNRLITIPWIDNDQFGLGAYGRAEYTGTVDVLPLITIDDATISTANIEKIFAKLTLTSTEGIDPTVHYTIKSDTAFYGENFDFIVEGDKSSNQLTGTLTFTQESLQSGLNISTTSPSSYQVAKFFTITLSDPQHAKFSGNQKEISATITIIDRKGLPELKIQSSPAYERDGFIKFIAQIDRPSSLPVTFHIETPQDAATVKERFVPLSETITIPANSISTTFSIQTIDNQTADGDKRVPLIVSDEQNATLISDQPSGDIRDDELQPSLSINNSAANENKGSLDFIITLLPAAIEPVTVRYSLQGRTAEEGKDFPSNQQDVITIEAGKTEALLSVNITNDLVVENDETLIVLLSDPSPNIVIRQAEGVGTIVNDDGVPTISLDTSSPIVGTESSGKLTFNVKLSPASAQDVRVHYQTVPGTATAGSDFEMIQGTLTITAGQTENTVPVKIIKDNIANEPDETLTLQLSNPEGAELGEQTEAVGTILADSTSGSGSLPILTIKDATVVAEGSDAQFAVELDKLSAKDVTFSYSTINGTAQGDIDFKKADNEIWTIPAGTKSTILTIKTLSDTVSEGNETFTVSLANEQNAVISDREAVETISDRTGKPQVIVSQSVPVSESSGVIIFPVELTPTSTSELTFNYSLPLGNAPGAAEQSDYDNTSGTITFGANSSTPKNPLRVTIKVDNIANEPNETFEIVISDLQGVKQSSQTGTIIDDTPKPKVTIDNGTADETENVMKFKVSMDYLSAIPLDLVYSTQNPTPPPTNMADPNVDYQLVSNGKLTIPALATPSPIEIIINDDATYEGSEIFNLKLNSIEPENMANINGSTGEAQGTITDEKDKGNFGNITVKVVALAPDGKAFTKNQTFNFNSKPLSTFTLTYTNGDCPTCVNVFGNRAIGLYEISQNTNTTSNLWDITEISCKHRDGTPGSTYKYGNDDVFNEGENIVTIDLKAGSDVTCTFTNTLQSGKVKVTKSIQTPPNFNETISSFTLTLTCGENHYPVNFSSNPNETVIDKIPVGSKCSITQTPPNLSSGLTWYRAKDVEIKPNNDTISKKDGQIDFTVTNTIEENPAYLTICVDPPDSPFTITVGDNEQSLDSGCTDPIKQLQDSVSVTETLLPNSDSISEYTISQTQECGKLSLDIVNNKASTNVGLTPGQSMTCSFTNTKNVTGNILDLSQDSSVTSATTNGITTYTVAFTVTITNTTPDKITGVVVTNTVTAPNATIEVSNSNEGKCFQIGEDNYRWKCDPATFFGGLVYEIHLYVTTTDQTTITNHVEVTSTKPESRVENTHPPKN